MLSFQFSEAQEAWRRQVREFALRELLPRYQENDALERYPIDGIRGVVRLADAFWEGRDAADRDLVACGITAEEVARGDFNVVLPSLGPPYQTQFFADFSPAQQERWYPALLSGEEMIALAITEPTAGSDMAKLAARAERKGDGWVIDGVKSSVSYLNAAVFYTFVRTDPDAGGWEGISAFLVPRDTPGLSFEPFDDLGCRAVPRGVVRYDGVEVPDGARVGELGSAFVRISRFFDVNRAIIGLKCIGAALQSIDETLEHMKGRTAFGTTLMGHQGASFPIAESMTLLEMARWQCYRVLWLRQRGIPCQREGAMVKWLAPKVAAEAIHRCLLRHGHLGYSKALPHQQRLRDVIGWQIGDGAEEVMKLIVTRDLAERGSAPAA